MAANTTGNNSIPCILQEAWPEGPTFKVFLRCNRLILLSVLGLPVCMVGIVTSGLSICLFCRDKTTPRTTCKLLIVTSLIDVQFLLFSLLYLQPLTFCKRSSPLRRLLLTNIIFSFVNILECFRNWLVVLIGVERFLVICFPVRSKVWWTGKITDSLMAACFVFSVVVRLPLISYLSLESVKPKGSVTAWLYQLHSFTDSILVTLIPLIILIVCSLQIGRGLQQSDHFRWGQGKHPERQRASTSSTSSNCSVARRVKLTRGLLIVIVTFTLFMLPMVPVSIVQLLSHHFFTSSCTYFITLHVCSYVATLGSQMNSTANFFVYIVYWGKYRKMLKRMLGCQYAKRILSPKKRVY
ncbi:unnamed protein product [Dibothriocephalus latus]|uniref:G-protein coupled receptors family 1 profile domain-containing protein n=1 Tax=Dibothriocephalus latus TaxID=60516 RepID=A0A3P7NP63_DIBLA|nr:unnamed protein product [Dibothriocephalus latus]